MRSLTPSDLRVPQNIAAEFMDRVPKCGVFMEVGLGKCGAAITLVAKLFDQFDTDCVLVVAPLRVSKKTWPDELKLWTQARYLTHELLWNAKTPQRKISATGEKRLNYWYAKIDRLEVELAEAKADYKALPTPRDAKHIREISRSIKDARRCIKWGTAAAWRPADIHIINRENVIWLVHFWGKYWPYDVVIYDESSDLKNGRKVLRWRAMRQVMGVTARFIELTGTPAPKGLMDLWGQIYVLDGGERLGRTITAYREKYFTSDFNGYVYTPRPDALEKITAAISDITITLRSKDYLTLPETIYNTIPIVLSDEEMETYKAMERDYIVELWDGGEIEAVTEAALTTKLLQLSNGLVYDRDKKAHFFHSRKIEGLKDYIAEMQGQNVMVAYYYQHDLAALRRAFPKAKVFSEENEDQIVDEWNSGLLDLMLIHPISGGHGLNIQFGGRRILWYGPLPTIDLEPYQQLNGRIEGARAVGQGTAFIDHFVAVGTWDEYVMERMKIKDAGQNVILDTLKGRIATNS